MKLYILTKWGIFHMCPIEYPNCAALGVREHKKPTTPDHITCKSLSHLRSDVICTKPLKYTLRAVSKIFTLFARFYSNCMLLLVLQPDSQEDSSYSQSIGMYEQIILFVIRPLYHICPDICMSAQLFSLSVVHPVMYFTWFSLPCTTFPCFIFCFSFHLAFLNTSGHIHIN